MIIGLQDQTGMGMFAFSWMQMVSIIFQWLPNYFSLALLFFSARIVFQRRRDAAEIATETALQPVSAKRFFIFLALALLVVIIGIAAVRGFLITWWLGPWYTWPWPEWFV